MGAARQEFAAHRDRGGAAGEDARRPRSGVELGVNPNTAQRALAELRLRLCRSERASGRYVTSDEARIDEVRADLATDAADEFVRRVRGLKMAHDQARALLDKRWDSHEHHTTDIPDGGGA